MVGFTCFIRDFIGASKLTFRAGASSPIPETMVDHAVTGGMCAVLCVYCGVRACCTMHLLMKPYSELLPSQKYMGICTEMIIKQSDARSFC